MSTKACSRKLSGITPVVMALGVLLIGLGQPLHACSIAGCADRGAELRASFTIQVNHQGRPIPGVGVKVMSFGDKNVERFSGETGVEGTVAVTDLPPGSYWIDVEKMGIGAAHHCFHVRGKSSRKAKRSMKYDWGDSPHATVTEIRGKFVHRRPGQGGTPLWNALHPLESPVAKAPLELKDPLTGTLTSTVTDDQGAFGFDAVPDGIYVLSTAGLESRSFLIRVTQTAEKKQIDLLVREDVYPPCGVTPFIDIRLVTAQPT
jgi:hypothetical protein